MEKLSIKEVAAACGGTLLWGDENTIIEGVTTDSRQKRRKSAFYSACGADI